MLVLQIRQQRWNWTILQHFGLQTIAVGEKGIFSFGFTLETESQGFWRKCLFCLVKFELCCVELEGIESK